MNECYGINRIPVIILWKLFFFSGQKSQKKNWVKIFCDTHTSHLYLSEVRYLWFIVIYRELLWMSSLYFLVNTCGFLWFQRGQMSLAKSKNTRNHKKPQEIHFFFARTARTFGVGQKHIFAILWINVISCENYSCVFLWIQRWFLWFLVVDSSIVLKLLAGDVLSSYNTCNELLMNY